MLRSENTFGASSPKRIVNIVKGSTTRASARTVATAGDRWNCVFKNGWMLSFAPAPPMAAAMAASSVTATCTAARLASMFSFMYKAALAPARFSPAKTRSRATVTDAKAIS